MTTPSPAIFLDRDGTLHRDAVYMIRFEDFEPLPGVEEALRLLQGAGYRLFGVTNQSGVARGFFSLEDVQALNDRICGYFHDHGSTIEEIAVCPHLPGAPVAAYDCDCPCRKPKPGMLFDLAKKHNLDLTRSYMVGDMPRDVLAGVSAGTKAVLIPGSVSGSELDNTGYLKEFTTLLEFAKSVAGARKQGARDGATSTEGADASHA
jgi:D-glycero-D-manno-heptose 1,7-bisphosphate phosphatase